MEVAAESVHGALDAFMAIIVSGSQDLLQQWRCRWNVQATIKHNHTVEQRALGHRVRRSRLVIDSEVKAEQLADPVVLWNGREPLVEEVLLANWGCQKAAWPAGRLDCIELQ